MNPGSEAPTEPDEPRPPGRHLAPLGATGTRGGDELRGLGAGAPSSSRSCLFDDDDARRGSRAHRAHAASSTAPSPAAGPGSATAPRGRPVGPAHGLRFNPAKLLLDPYARAIERRPSTYPTRLTAHARRRPGHAPRRPRLRDVRAPGGGGRRPRLRLGRRPPRPDTPLARHRHLRAARQGLHRAAPGCPSTCAARTPGSPTRRSIDHLRDLGVTAVELLPVHHFVSEPALDRRAA